MLNRNKALSKHTASIVKRNSNPREVKRICWGLKLKKFHTPIPPKRAAAWMLLSMEPNVLSTGDRRDTVSIPFNLNSSSVYSLCGICNQSIQLSHHHQIQVGHFYIINCDWRKLGSSMFDGKTVYVVIAANLNLAIETF